MKFVALVIVIFLIAGFSLGIYFVAPSLTSYSSTTVTSPNPQLSSDNAIVRENALPGTSAWRIPTGHESTTQIQGYADATSVQPGKSISFYVSTQEAGTRYTLDVYRLGWYDGLGGRIMASVYNLVGDAQGYYDETTHTLTGCLMCTVIKSTGLIETHWKRSYTLKIGSDWTTGIYLAKLIDANGMQSYVPFDVLGNEHSKYIAVTPDTTYAAYNDWGRTSLYEADDPEFGGTGTANAQKASQVSFDKPYSIEDGSSQVLVFILPTVRWMEQNGYDVSYASDVDLHTNANLLLTHKAYISLGHDEYWTKAMRDNVEHARDQGIGLAFMGADAVYWQMRFDADSAGVPNRTITCYKVETDHNDLQRDPMYGKDDSVVTAMWRDPVVGRPENALVGVMFSNLTHTQNGFAWRVDPAAGNLPLLKNTGLQPGQAYGCGVVGYEWDNVYDNPALNPSYTSTKPKNLHVLSTSRTISSDTKQADTSNSTYYIAPSGAVVFATGSIYWATALDNYRLHADPACGSESVAVPAMQNLMKNVMDALVVKHNPNSF